MSPTRIPLPPFRPLVTACRLAFTLCLLLPVSSVLAQSGDASRQPIVIEATNVPLASLQDAALRAMQRSPVILFHEIPNFHNPTDTRAQTSNLQGPDPLRQSYTPSASTSVLTQFDGADNTDQGINVTPPDTDGDVSGDAVDRYVQMINLMTTVFDKSGSIVPNGGPFFTSAFWSGFGGLCESNDNGDPIVLYDETNQRWLVSQFAFNSTSSGPWYECIAVSQTSDPLGAYNRYAFDFSAIGFPDYPKLGFTTESITLMANLFNPGFSGTFIGAADKACILAGNPSCTLVGANLGTSEFGFVAGDLDDPAGTAGFVPALFATAMTTSGLFDVWEVDPDFTTPPNTTITRIARVPIAAFDSDLCTAFRERCVPHPGSGSNLETLSGRLMHRLQIRDFGTHLSMVAAHTVDADAAPPGTQGRTGVRWYELRSTDGGVTWSLHQAGTHAPNDGLDRWMPSIAMNAAGDIGVGFMVSSATTPVEIRVTGQSVFSSGSGAFDNDEDTCRAGVAGADWSGRAGDYSATKVDPDRDTFWHTNEFGRSAVFRGWGTAVCEFALENASPTAVSVAAVSSGILDQGKGRKAGTATVTVVTDQGAAAAGYTVTGLFSGDINESVVGVTDASGQATLVTTGTAKGQVSVGFCVDDVSGTLPYVPADNADPGFACTSGAATAVHVAAIVTGSQNAGGGDKAGTATVTVVDDLGAPAAGYTVTGVFSVDFDESVDGVTNASGQVTLVTTGTTRGRVDLGFCVDNVAGGLTYDPAGNADPGFDCGASKAGPQAALAGASGVPIDYGLEQNYPNPFNPTTVIAYTVPEQAYVRLRVYNVLGELVATLTDGYVDAGRHTALLDASGLSAGLYLYTIEAGSFAMTRRMTLLK